MLRLPSWWPHRYKQKAFFLPPGASNAEFAPSLHFGNTSILGVLPDAHHVFPGTALPVPSVSPRGLSSLRDTCLCSPAIALADVISCALFPKDGPSLTLSPLGSANPEPRGPTYTGVQEFGYLFQMHLDPFTSALGQESCLE